MTAISDIMWRYIDITTQTTWNDLKFTQSIDLTFVVLPCHPASFDRHLILSHYIVSQPYLLLCWLLYCIVVVVYSSLMTNPFWDRSPWMIYRLAGMYFIYSLEIVNSQVLDCFISCLFSKVQNFSPTFDPSLHTRRVNESVSIAPLI